MLGNRLGRQPRGVLRTRLGQARPTYSLRPQPGRVRVEAQHDLALPLLDERCEAVTETGLRATRGRRALDSAAQGFRDGLSKDAGSGQCSARPEPRTPERPL